MQYEAKLCKACGETKPVAEFYPVRANKDGLCYYCIICSKEQAQDWRYSNYERHKANARKYYHKHKLGISLKRKEARRLKRETKCST